MRYLLQWRRSTCGLIASAVVFSTAFFNIGWTATTNVHFGSFYFNPQTVNIRVGDTVMWINDGGSHTVTGTGSDAICGNGPVSSSCSHTFSTAGSFPYECTVIGHASSGMTGLVVVAPSPPAPPVLTNAAMLANQQFRFTVLTTASHTNTVQATTNLSLPGNWVPVATVVPASNSFVFTDTNASKFGIRIYRVVGQ